MPWCRQTSSHYPSQLNRIYKAIYTSFIVPIGTNSNILWLKFNPFHAVENFDRPHHHAVSANRILWVYAGFWWYHGILVVHLQDSVGAFWAIKDQDASIRGLSVENVMTDGLSRVMYLVMYNVVSHYQNYWYIFCGREVLKRVRNVTGMVPWRRLVAYYSYFIL